MVLTVFIKDFLLSFLLIIIFALFFLKKIIFKINLGVYTKVMFQNRKR